MEIKEILGTPDNSTWSQVYHFSSLGKKEKRGELVLLVSVKSKQVSDLSTFGREIISRFHEEYFGNLEGSLFQRLKEAVTKIAQEKLEYFEISKELVLLALVFWKKFVYLAVWGLGEIILRREGTNGILISGEKNKLKMASGIVEEKDIFLMATNELLENIPEGMVVASLSSENLEIIGEALTPVVHARERQGGMAMVAIKPFEENPQSENFLEKGKEEQKKQFQKIFKLKENLRNLFFLRLNFRVKKRVFEFFKKKSIFWVATLFLLLLLLSIFMGWQKQKIQQKRLKTKNLAVSLEEKISAVMTLKNLDPEGALKLKKEIEGVLVQLSSLDKNQADLLRQKIDTLTSDLREEPFVPEVFYNFNLVGDDIEIKSVYGNSERILIFDGKKKRIIDFDVSKKGAKIVGGGTDMPFLKAVFFKDQKIYLVTEEAIGVLENKKFKKEKEIDKAKTSVDLAAIWSSGIYIFDSKEKQIWKYSFAKEGLSDPSPWFKQEVSFDSSQLVSMVVDGNIWFVDRFGKLYKFFSGKAEKIEQSSLPDLKEIKFMAKLEEGGKIYLWDEAEKAVFVLDEKGNFLNKVRVDLEGVTGIIPFLDSSRKEGIFFLTKDRLFKVEGFPSKF